MAYNSAGLKWPKKKHDEKLVIGERQITDVKTFHCGVLLESALWAMS